MGHEGGGGTDFDRGWVVHEGEGVTFEGEGVGIPHGPPNLVV
jgi:hypothetical protein